MSDVEKLTEFFETHAKTARNSKVVKVPPREKSGSGKALSADIREAAEKAFGVDLSRVRIHEDPSVDELTKETRAKAYVSGNDIVFAPGASKDQRLLAHELAHIVQQRGTKKDGHGAI